MKKFLFCSLFGVLSGFICIGQPIYTTIGGSGSASLGSPVAGSNSAPSVMVVGVDSNGNLTTNAQGSVTVTNALVQGPGGNKDASLITNVNLAALPLTVVNTGTNFVTWRLSTNGIANGDRFNTNITTTTTSGIQELEAISPFVHGQMWAGGLKIQLDNGVFPISTILQLTNDVILEGAGKYSTILYLTCPTNTISIQQVMTNLPMSQNSTTSWGLTNVGIIRLTATTNSTFANAPYFHNYIFKDLSIVCASNFPAALVSGIASTVKFENCILSGPGFSTVLQPVTVTNQLLIGAAIWCGNDFDFDNSLVQGLADGVLNVGNAFTGWNNSDAFLIGWGGGTHTNSYPTTNWLSAGCALFNGSGNLQNNINGYRPYGDCRIDILNAGFLKVNDYLSQTSVGYVCTASGGATHFQQIFNLSASPETPTAFYITGGNYVISNLTVALTDPSFFVTVDYPDVADINSGYMWNQYGNGQLIYSWLIGDPTGQYSTPPGFYVWTNLYVNGKISGNASGLTNFNGLTTLTYSTNTIVVGSLGVTNNTTSVVYLLSITAGTAMTVKDKNNQPYDTLIVGDAVPLKPGESIAGTGITAKCHQLWP